MITNFRIEITQDDGSTVTVDAVNQAERIDWGWTLNHYANAVRGCGYPIEPDSLSHGAYTAEELADFEPAELYLRETGE